MSVLNLFGALAVFAMMVFYYLEDRRAIFTLAFAGGCLASSVYGWLAGTWPFGVVEFIWALVAAKRWWNRRAAVSTGPAR